MCSHMPHFAATREQKEKPSEGSETHKAKKDTERNCTTKGETLGISPQNQQDIGAENRAVKACCTAPSLNPNMNTQKNKASPKRPQFFLPGLLKVALLPGHWCAWNRRCVDPPFSVSGNPGISEPAGPPASSPALQSGVVPGRANVRVTMHAAVSRVCTFFGQSGLM